MKIYPYQDGEELIELVEMIELEKVEQRNRELVAALFYLESRLNNIAFNPRLPMSFSADVANQFEALEDALIEIEACCYEDDSSNAAADSSWHLARKALIKSGHLK